MALQKLGPVSWDYLVRPEGIEPIVCLFGRQVRKPLRYGRMIKSVEFPCVNFHYLSSVGTDYQGIENRTPQ